MNWDEYFIRQCLLAAQKSKDPSNQFGSAIIGPGKEIRSTGYNGFPRGVREVPEFDGESAVEARWERPEKYFFIEHAERNAIFNAARAGTSTDGCTMYVSGFPCHDCSRAIIQAGIKELVYQSGSEDYNTRWAESIRRSKTMFYEAGVQVREYTLPECQPTQEAKAEPKPQPESNPERERNMRSWIEERALARGDRFAGHVLRLETVWGLTDAEAIELVLDKPMLFRIEGTFGEGLWSGDLFYTMLSVSLAQDSHPCLDGFTSFQTPGWTWSLKDSLHRSVPTSARKQPTPPFVAASAEHFMALHGEKEAAA